MKDKKRGNQESKEPLIIPLFAFVEFYERPQEIDKHESFPFCSITLLESEIAKSPIYQVKGMLS